MKPRLAPARRSRVLKFPILKTEKSRSPRRLKPLASVGVTAGARSVTSKLNSGSGATMSEIAFAWKVEVDFLAVLARCLIIRRTMCSCLRTPLFDGWLAGKFSSRFLMGSASDNIP